MELRELVDSIKGWGRRFSDQDWGKWGKWAFLTWLTGFALKAMLGKTVFRLLFKIMLFGLLLATCAWLIGTVADMVIVPLQAYIPSFAQDFWRKISAIFYLTSSWIPWRTFGQLVVWFMLLHVTLLFYKIMWMIAKFAWGLSSNAT